MGKFFVFFLFWTSCLIQVETLTKFRIGGTVTCDYNKNYDYHVTLYEWDVLQDNQIGLVSSGIGRGSGGFHIEGEDTHDGLGNYYFDLYVEIVHSCNSYVNLKQKYNYFLGYFLIKHGEEYVMSYNINITNAGKYMASRKLINTAGFAKFNNEDSDLGFPLK
ncbi:Protein CBG02186 [Caenorhabditis briggsae]|uniref:Protein CBG02186 n=1 Tax=Caenorhabditis briggsae TaxID=6238 RepID=A8WS48_CAEBR|nr:Protein CBG02186 [Caenorhabditis briggsae]CAP23306.1 Protein CBG02186 [Caenorhabditis briggsae]